MKISVHIQRHLAEQGVPDNLTQCNADLLSKFLFPDSKPLVFQSPMKLFLKQGVVSGVSWGLLVWLLFWRTTQMDWFLQILGMVMFGTFVGASLAYRVVKVQQKLGNVSWEKWCSVHYESAP
ncbi:magnesium transporter [Vibrio parahaemolyticus]|nr:magnesium transporter [Vibrio parahaemolyticus]